MNNSLNRSILLINKTLKGTHAIDPSEPWSNEGVLDTLQNWNLNLRNSLVSYWGHPFFKGSYPSARGIESVYSKSWMIGQRILIDLYSIGINNVFSPF